MAGIASIISVVGTVVSAVGSIATGAAARRQADYQAAQLDIKADEEFAAGQREGLEYAKQKRLALSRMTARAAGSGLDASGSTIARLAGETEAYGTLQQQMAQYGGASRKAGYKAQATSTRASGRAAQTASYFDAAGTILGGFTSLYDKYGRPGYFGGPRASPYGAASAWY